MSQIKITLTIDIPEGARVSTPDVDYLPAEPAELMAAPPPPYDPDVIVRPVSQAAPGCPQHGAMSRFPPGVNRNGKPYNASWRCPAKDCATKPLWDKDAAA